MGDLPALEVVPRDRDAVGGYFGQEPVLPRSASLWPDAQGFQSARAAFLAVLHLARPRRVWLPWYLCDSMTEPPEQAEIPIVRYRLDPCFGPSAELDPRPDDLVLAVNYFGLLDNALDQLALRVPPGQLVIDNAQALYARPRPVLANLYSPRKFLGVADGGYLISHTLHAPNYPRDAGAPPRGAHLAFRPQPGAEAGYAAYLQSEATLSRQPPLRISERTERTVRHADHASIQDRRRQNFAFIANRLDRYSALAWQLAPGQVPLCYPFLPASVKGLRQGLWQARVYAACYWPELIDSAQPVPARERQWAQSLIALPVDQRYSPNELERYVVRPLEAILA